MQTSQPNFSSGFFEGSKDLTESERNHHFSNLQSTSSQQEDDSFLRSLWHGSDQINTNLPSDISISASSNNGDSNSTGLSPPEMNSGSASNISNSDHGSPHSSLKDFIFTGHYSKESHGNADANGNAIGIGGGNRDTVGGGELNVQFGSANMMMGMGMGMGMPMDPFQSDSSMIQNNRMISPTTTTMGMSQQPSPFLFANRGFQAVNGSSSPTSDPPSRRNLTNPQSLHFNKSNSVDPSMMSNLNPTNPNQFINRFASQSPLPPTHIQNQMQQLSPHTSTANYQTQLHFFLRQQAEQFGPQHHQQALIQAQALAFAQSQYVATIQSQHLLQQDQRNGGQSNKSTLGSSPSSIPGSSLNSPETNLTDLQSARKQSLSTPAAPAIQRRPSARDLQDQAPKVVQTQSQASGSHSKPSTRKRKGSDEGRTQETGQSQSQPLAASGMPRMEVGSNSTARAAIQRLKAKQQADTQAGPGSQENSSSKRAQIGQWGPNRASFSFSTADKPPRSTKNVAHNAIERRYRNNINDRISALRSSVPALCELRAKPKGKGKSKNPADDLVDGVVAATKLNKGVILGKATEYIHHLKRRETSLTAEVTGLRELVKSLEGGEELLELWEAEWKKVEAENQREEKANQAAAESDDGEEDEDDEDEDEDERPHKLQRLNSSGSPTSASSASSGRYMMAAFLGVSFFGGAAEINTASHQAAPAASSNSIHSAGGRVIGAGHQLLKRANVPVLDPSSTHHFDHVPTHALAFEILRALMVVAIVFFIFWPMISRLFRHTSSKSTDESKQASNLQRRQTMLAVLSRRHPTPTPSEIDQALRLFLKAPRSRLSAVLGLAFEAGRYALRRAPFGKLIEREEMSNLEKEEATVWLRLLEVESILRDEAQISDLIRAHTIIKVANMRLPSKTVDSTSSALTPARISATIAIALARSEGRNGRILNRRRSLDNPAKASSSSQTWTMDAAQEFWVRAQKLMMVEEEEMEEAREESRARATISGEPSLISGTTGWLSSVLRLGMDEALSLCPAQSDVSQSFREAAIAAEQELQAAAAAGNRSSGVASSASVTHTLSLRALDTSPLQAIADAKHRGELAGVWAKLFGNVVRSTCPNAQESRNPISEFINSSTSPSQSFNMHIVSDLSSRAALTTQISRLAATAPPLTPSSSLSRTTLAAWALLVGNVPAARSLAAKLALRGPGGEEPITQTCAAAHSLVELVLGSSSAGVFLSSQGAPQPFDDVDALASAAIRWLSFLRQFNARLELAKQLAEQEASVSKAEEKKVNGEDVVESGSENQDELKGNSIFNQTFSAKAETQADQLLVSSALKLRKLLAKAEPCTISLALRSMAFPSIRRPSAQMESDSDSSDSTSDSSKSSKSSKSSSSSSSSSSASPTSTPHANASSPTSNSKTRQDQRLAVRRAQRIRKQALEIEMELEDARDSLTEILTSLGKVASRSTRISQASFPMDGRVGGSSWLRKVLQMKDRSTMIDSALDSEEDSGVGEFE